MQLTFFNLESLDRLKLCLSYALKLCVLVYTQIVQVNQKWYIYFTQLNIFKLVELSRKKRQNIE